MPVCIECGEPVPTLYVEYGKGNIRLQRCDKCQTFADRYLEFDYVIIFIDMLLHKRPVYRHLIFNRLQYSARGWNVGLPLVAAAAAAVDAPKLRPADAAGDRAA
nr:sterol homeostasis protein [Polyrhizophydium stewartii]